MTRTGSTERVVVFDLGKVLLDFDYGRLAADLAPDCAIGAEELRLLLDQSPLLFQFETGLITSREFYETICSRASYRGGESRFTALFGDIFTPIPGMIQLHESIRAAGLRAYLFSNTNPIAVEHLKKTYPFFQHFDGYFLSFQEKLMKPAPKLYQIVQERLGVAGRDILYIDDRPENHAAGLVAGWDSILHRDPVETWRQVRERLPFLPQ